VTIQQYDNKEMSDVYTWYCNKLNLSTNHKFKSFVDQLMPCACAGNEKVPNHHNHGEIRLRYIDVRNLVLEENCVVPIVKCQNIQNNHQSTDVNINEKVINNINITYNKKHMRSLWAREKLAPKTKIQTVPTMKINNSLNFLH